jgi:hypothetical protein
MTVLITLTLAGTDVGPFDIYSNIDGYTTPVVTGISRATLLAGYYATVPDGTTEVLVQSTGTCNTQLYLNVSGNTTTTTSTSSSTTTTTTTVLRVLTISYNTYTSAFTILASVAPTQSVTINAGITADGYPTNTCTTGAVAGASLNGNILGLSVGQSANSHSASATSGTWSSGLTSRLNAPVPLAVNGVSAGSFNNGDVVTIGGYGYIVYVISNCIS